MLNHRGTVEIETDRLILRSFVQEDAEDMLKHWISDPLVQSMYGEPHYENMDELQLILNKYIEQGNSENGYRWAIILKEADECIGQIAFFLVNEVNHFSEIEYCVGREFQGRGYVPEAVKAILDFGFMEVNFHKIQICHREDNMKSKRVIEKCKFTYEGTLRDFFYRNERYYDRLYYSMLRSEWENRKYI